MTLKKMRWALSPGEITSVVLTQPAQSTEEIVLLIHGFMSHKDSETNQALTERLIGEGVATLRFDLFGHGESDGPFQQLTLSRCLHQVDALLAWIKDNGYKRIGLVGSSFGGLIAIHTAAHCADLAALALRCPVSHYPAIWQDRLTPSGMKRWKEDGQITFATEDGKATLAYGYYEDLLRHDTYSDATRIRTPTIIVHGDADYDVPADQSLRLFDTLRLTNARKRLVLMPGADHGFSKEADFNEMIAHIFQWVTPLMKPVGS